MDENRIAGTARNLGGRVEEGVGRVTGDAKTQVRGMADQAAGAAQDIYGQARDTAADAAVAARDTAASFEKWLRRTIETQPYTAPPLVAIGIGWLLQAVCIGLCKSSAGDEHTPRRADWRSILRQFQHIEAAGYVGACAVAPGTSGPNPFG